MSAPRDDSGAHHDRLTQLDNSFLVYEDTSSNAAMHVATTQIHEAAPLRGPDGSIDIERIEEYVVSRLDRIPRYRQRIARTPIEGHPVWVDDPSFNVHYHVRHTRLPHPGTLRQLKRLVGRVFSQRLDRDKPLWELWLVEGLEGDRVAFISKVHHCMVDGVSGAELIAALLTTEPMQKPEAPALWKPRPAPSTLALGAGEVSRLFGAPRAVAGAVGRLLRDEGNARSQLQMRLQAMGRVVSDSSLPTLAPFNRPVGPHRRMDWVRLSLDEIKQTGRALGATVNDVVLATTAGAFARYLSVDRGEDLNAMRFRVMTPVSMHRAGEDDFGNRVSAWTLELPIQESDPRARVDRIREATRDLKESHAALGIETFSEVFEWTGAAPLSFGARFMQYGTPFNAVVTNVPGPPVALYLLESKMLEIHPHVPILGTLGIGVALFSYDGGLSWGFTSDWDLVPDLHRLVEATEHAFAELRDAAG